MKHWRARLSPADHAWWTRRGVLRGTAWEQAETPGYDSLLERQLVEAQPGGEC